MFGRDLQEESGIRAIMNEKRREANRLNPTLKIVNVLIESVDVELNGGDLVDTRRGDT
jgi:hypothetical protein